MYLLVKNIVLTIPNGMYYIISPICCNHCIPCFMHSTVIYSFYEICCMLKVIYYFTEQVHFIKTLGFNLVFKCVLKSLNLELKGLSGLATCYVSKFFTNWHIKGVKLSVFSDVRHVATLSLNIFICNYWQFRQIAAKSGKSWVAKMRLYCCQFWQFMICHIW